MTDSTSTETIEKILMEEFFGGGPIEGLEEGWAESVRMSTQAIEAYVAQTLAAELSNFIENEPPYGKWIEHLKARVVELKANNERT